MSNRKRLRVKGKRTNALRSMISGFGQPDNRPHIPTADEVFAPGAFKDQGMSEAEREKIEALSPNNRASTEPIIKVVQAKHKGVVVGDAYIHDDGQVTLVFHKDAPEWAIREINDTAMSVGYSMNEGNPNGPA